MQDDFPNLDQQPNVSLQLTGESPTEVVVAARLAGKVRHLHLAGQDIARS
jgi:hypothetical protein